VIKGLGPLILGVLTLAVAANRGFAQTPQFSIASLKGVCGFTQAANVVEPHFLPRPVVGTMNFDGAGGVSLTATANNAGVVASGSESGGTYSVNPDGRTGTIDFSSTGGAVRSFVIVAGGKELLFINTGKVNPATGLLNQVQAGECDF
jgi:hypothetical protein